MNRTLGVDVDQSTWPGRNRLPAFPTAFHSGFATHDINVPAMLLMIGYLTTPTSATGVSLSEFWAWIRYLAAVTRDDDLRLTRAFADLDAHQKTLLSDDFGMGAAMLWLNQRLPFDRIVDGRYFMQRFAASVGATQRRGAKRGPNKTPDFVARDTSGVWHVIECKGTQSGFGYCITQLGEQGPPPSGGVAQKRSIIFPRTHTGQRLVCGLCIGIEDGEPSRLTIIDPPLEPEEPFEISAGQIGYADDAATRGVMSKVLRLAGFEITAEATASPLGRTPAATRYSSHRMEVRRQKLVNERDQRARDELDMVERRPLVFESGFRGRELSFDLPRPVYVDDEPMMRAIVRQAVNSDVLAQLREQPTIEAAMENGRSSWIQRLGTTKLKGDERTALMSIGNLFRSELILG